MPKWQPRSEASPPLALQGKLTEAEPIYREALAMRRNLAGNEPPDVADLINDLTAVLEQQGKQAESNALLREDIAMNRKWASNDPEGFETRLYQVADALYRQSEFAAAEPYYRELVESRRNRLGDVIGPMASLGRLLADWAWSERATGSEIGNSKPEIAGRASEAEQLLRDCLATRLRAPQASQWGTDETRSRLGGALLAVAVTDPAATDEARTAKFVLSWAPQADGKIIIVGAFTRVNRMARNNIARLHPDGTLDLDFDPPNVNGRIVSVMIQTDGMLVIAGDFTGVGGVRRNYIARLENDPATQSLAAPDSTRVQWLRGGTSPEVGQVSFDLSTDGGETWTLLGSGTHMAGGWELDGLTLPDSGHLRARARTLVGNFLGGSGTVETVRAFPALSNGEFRIDSVVIENGNLILSFPSGVGRSYTLWRSDTLAGRSTDTEVPRPGRNRRIASVHRPRFHIRTPFLPRRCRALGRRGGSQRCPRPRRRLINTVASGIARGLEFLHLGAQHLGLRAACCRFFFSAACCGASGLLAVCWADGKNAIRLPEIDASRLAARKRQEAARSPRKASPSAGTLPQGPGS